MKVGITVSSDEVKEAVRAWLLERGVPVVALDSMVLEFKQGSGYAWSKTQAGEVRFEIAYECESLSASGGTVEPNPKPIDPPSQWVDARIEISKTSSARSNRPLSPDRFLDKYSGQDPEDY